jgi:molybdenum cofactor cytidylyltransferase
MPSEPTRDNREAFPIACIVLAAGAGSRYGAPKLGATLPDGTRFVDAISRTAHEAGARPVVVVAPPGHRAPPDTRAIINPDAQSQQIASIRLGVANLANTTVRGALVWPVDHPLVRRDTLLSMIETARATGAKFVVPTFEGRRGHPGYFARETWTDLMTAVGAGAREVLHSRSHEVRELPVPDPGVLANIDTKADLDRALEQVTNK